MAKKQRNCRIIGITILEHLVSWGFIVMETEDEFDWGGVLKKCASDFLFSWRGRDSRPMEVKSLQKSYRHSKYRSPRPLSGGVGAINRATANDHSHKIKAIYAVSPADIPLSQGLQWEYDPSVIRVPTLLVSSTGNSDEKLIVSFENLTRIYSPLATRLTSFPAL